MSTDKVLIERREELKSQLAAGKYKTLVDICLGWFERLLRKISRRSQPLPLWVVAIILCILVPMVSILGIYLAGDWASFSVIAEAFALGFRIGFLIQILNTALFVLTTLLINQYIHRLFALWQNDILDRTDSLLSLNDFEGWLKAVCNWRLHLFVIIICNMLFNPYGIYLVNSQFHLTAGFGQIFSATVLNIFSVAFLYQLVMVILLSVRLHRYELKLFSPDPSSSQLVSHLSGELGLFAYFFAIFSVVVTLEISSFENFSFFGIVIVLLWIPIIALFSLNQTSLSNIIRRSKWKKLDEIQARIEKLQELENYTDEETMKAINRLLDYHDRIKATRNSAVDVRTMLNFVNSLLLPLIAFILGNLDLVFNLFSRKP